MAFESSAASNAADFTTEKNLKKTPAQELGEQSFEDKSQSGTSRDSFDHVRFQAYGGEGQKAESQPAAITQGIRPTSGSGLAREAVSESSNQAVSLQKFKITDGAPLGGIGASGKVNDGLSNVLKSEDKKGTVTLQKSSGGVGLETEVNEPGKKTLTNQIVEPRIQQTENFKQIPETAGAEAVKQQPFTKGGESVTQSLTSQKVADTSSAPTPIVNEGWKSKVGSGGREITSSVTREGEGSVGSQKLSVSESQNSGGNNRMGSGLQRLTSNVERPSVQAGSERVGSVGEKSKIGESGAGSLGKFATELQKAPQNSAPQNNDKLVGGAGAPKSTERSSSEPLLKVAPNEKQIVTQVGNPPQTLTPIQKNTAVERASGGGDKPISVEKIPNFTSSVAKIPLTEKTVTQERIAQPEKLAPIARAASAEKGSPVEKGAPAEKAAPIEKIVQAEKPLTVQKYVEKVAQAEKSAPREKSAPLVKPVVIEALPSNSKLPVQDKVVNVERNPIVEKSVAGNKIAPAEKQAIEVRTHALADVKPLDKLAVAPKTVEKSITPLDNISTNKVVLEKAPSQISKHNKVTSIVLNGHVANTERAGTTNEKGHQQDKTAAGIRASMDIRAEAGRPNVEQAVNQTRIAAAREVLLGDIKPSPVARIDESNKSFVNVHQNVISGDIRPVQNTVKGSAELIPALFPIEHQTTKDGKENVINLSGNAFTKRSEIIASTTSDTTVVEGKRALTSPKLVALMTSLAEGKVEILRSPLARNQNVLELKSTKDRYVGGEFLLASLIVAAGMARKMPGKQPLPDTRDNNEIKKPDLIINKKSEFSPISDLKDHVTKSVGQLLESLQETVLGGKEGPAPELVEQFTENLDFSIHDDFGNPLDIHGDVHEEQVSLESQNEEQDANSKSKQSRLFRPIWLISKGETLVSIAEQQFGDGSIAWLIADLNSGKFVERNVDGKRVVEITTRQRLELPVVSDIIEFKRNRLAQHDAENIITIVTESQLDAEAIAGSFKNFLGTVWRQVFFRLTTIRTAA